MSKNNGAQLVKFDIPKDAESFFQLFRKAFIYPFSKKHFYSQFQNAPLHIRFRLTNKCDEACAHCFECSGPKNRADFVTPKDVQFYANSDNANFYSIYFTGGEWSTIYKTQPHYIRQVFENLDLSKSDIYTIQTNSRWMNGEYADQILDDLKHIQSKLGQSGKILKLDTSVDRYRSKHSIDGVIKLIRAVASDPEFKHTKIRLMSCMLDYKMANNKILRPEFFEPFGIKLTFQGRSFFNPYFEICYANDTRIVIHEENTTVRTGRARENNIGYKIFDPQTQCDGLVPQSTYMELSIREDGMVKWNSWYNWEVMVPYKDENGKNKSLSQIREELMNIAWRRNLRHNIKETALGLTPLVGQIRKMRQIKQMQDSYNENRKQIVVHAKKVNTF